MMRGCEGGRECGGMVTGVRERDRDREDGK